MALIVVYDSGVGGLSIYQEVAKQCPYHDYVFLSDNEAFPYGTKPEKDLVGRVMRVAAMIAQEYQPDVLVVACNTASTLVLPRLRETYDFNVVGVVPAIKPAAQTSLTKVIGLLATSATIDRDYTKQLVFDFASDCHVISLGSSELVQVAEDKLDGKPIDNKVIATILMPILEAEKLDTLVLACTHFPLLRDEITEVFNQHNKAIRLVDSGSAIAKRVGHFVGAAAPAEDTACVSRAVAVFTKPLGSSQMLKSLKQMGFTDIEYLPV